MPITILYIILLYENNILFLYHFLFVLYSHHNIIIYRSLYLNNGISQGLIFKN